MKDEFVRIALQECGIGRKKAEYLWVAGFRYTAGLPPAEQRQGEVERLRKELGNTQALLDQANYHKAQRGETIDTLRAQLSERDALMRFARKVALAAGKGASWSEDLVEQIDAALSASAEPSAPVERDERAEFERYEGEDPDGPQVDPMWMLRCTLDSEKYGILSVQSDWETWQARAALERKP